MLYTNYSYNMVNLYSVLDDTSINHNLIPYCCRYSKLVHKSLYPANAMFEVYPKTNIVKSSLDAHRLIITNICIVNSSINYG